MEVFLWVEDVSNTSYISAHCCGHTLLKDDYVGWRQAKKVVLLEEGFRRRAGRATGHNIPGDDDGSFWFAELGFRERLKSDNPFRLQLEEGFVGRETNVIASLWI